MSLSVGGNFVRHLFVAESDSPKLCELLSNIFIISSQSLRVKVESHVLLTALHVRLFVYVTRTRKTNTNTEFFLST